MLADSEFSLGHLLMEPGDVLFAYSDGVVEARNLEDRLFGTEAMVELVTADGSAADVVQRVDEAVRAFVGNADQSDDITMMALRRSRLS
jgi:sigma-B regulation protein RsbU (phosphoserine phosphatase)